MLQVLLLFIGLLSGPTALAAVGNDGRFDLSQETLNAKSKLDLNGTWRFYPKVFLQSADFNSSAGTINWPEGMPSVLIKVPGELTGAPGPDGQPMPNDTWGSFVLELSKIPP